MGRRPKQTFLQRRHTNGQQAREKMLNVTNHQGNANQNQNRNEILPHNCQNGYYQKDNKFKCWRGCGEKRTLMNCWQKSKLVQALQKTVWRFLKNLKIELPYDPAIALLDIYPKKTKALIQKDICTPMFTAALLIIAKMWKQPKGPLRDECLKKIYIFF